MPKVSIDEREVGIGVDQGSFYLTLELFHYPHYLLPASENNGCIAISVLFGFSRSWCGWTSCSLSDIGPCMTNMPIFWPPVESRLCKLTMDPLTAVSVSGIGYLLRNWSGSNSIVLLFGYVIGTSCNIVLSGI